MQAKTRIKTSLTGQQSLTAREDFVYVSWLQKEPLPARRPGVTPGRFFITHYLQFENNH